LSFYNFQPAQKTFWSKHIFHQLSNDDEGHEYVVWDYLKFPFCIEVVNLQQCLALTVTGITLRGKPERHDCQRNSSS